MMVDELGRCVDGDQVLYLLASARRDAGALIGPVVGTVMSNLGLEHALAERGIEFRRAQVGDRYVLAMLHEVGGTLGGETSGHILCLDKTTTGDGLISALQVLAVMKSTGAGLAELCAAMPKYPQVLVNVRVARRFDPMTAPSVFDMVSAVERKFNGRGRIVLRASGTEPVIRVMVEGDDASLVKAGARDIAAEDEAVAAGAAAPGAAGIAALAQEPCGPCSYGSTRIIFAAFPQGAVLPQGGGAMRRPMVAGNWKMHGSRSANESLLSDLRAAPGPGMAGRRRDISTVCIHCRRGAHRRCRSDRGGCARCVRRERGCIHGTWRCLPLCSRMWVVCRYVIVGHS